MKLSKFVENSKIHVSNMLSDLSKKWYLFHNLEHTLDVFERANYLLERERISTDFAELVQIAVLFHDSWFITMYEWHETEWINLFDEYFEWNENIFLKERLRFYDFVDNYFTNSEFSSDKIDIIKQLIIATIPTRQPSNKLEWLIKDADIDNLGRDDFFVKTDLLREEMKKIKWKEFTDFQRYNNVLSYMKWVRFYTSTQIMERNSKLIENIRKVEEIINSLS